jgi:integrase
MKQTTTVEDRRNRINIKPDINKRGPDRFATIIGKYKASGLGTVVDFLQTKARKSKGTAISFSFGLDYLNDFIEQNYKGYNIQTILPELLLSSKNKNKKIDLYKLLNGFVHYLQHDTTNGHDLAPASLNLYMTAARSYFQYNDIDVSPTKFKYKVSLPTVYHEDQQAIDANDIKNILNHCNNRRLKAYLLILASGGMRAIEALAIRECDIDFSGINFADPNDKTNPASVRVRKDYSKTRTERRIFVSNEAARYLHEWIEWKYRDRHSENKYIKNRVRSKEDLVFSTVNSTEPHGLYFKMLEEFQKVLELAGLGSRKEDGVYKRRKVTFHSFRRFVKTTISNQTNKSDYSEWFLGHKKNVYYMNKAEDLERIYRDECMRYLTFLDYPTLEATGKSFEAELKAKDKQIEELRQRDRTSSQRISQLENKIEELYRDETKMVRDETKMFKQGLQANLEHTKATKEFAAEMIRAFNPKQLTEEQINFLRSIFEKLFNASAESQDELKEIRKRF